MTDCSVRGISKPPTLINRHRVEVRFFYPTNQLTALLSLGVGRGFDSAFYRAYRYATAST
jgi:hypothetical protein